MKHKRIRLALLLIGLLAWLSVAFYGYRQVHADSSSSLTTVTIGYQKGDPVDISRQRGEFVKKMKAKGYKVVFKEFQNGAALMTALKAGSIDYARAGDTPPVTAQATGTQIAYIAAGATKEYGTGILVGKNSGITTLSQLKGKKIAYTSGTAAQSLIIKALKKAGLTTSDVTLVDMSQSAASVAFAKGQVDAWVTWDPYTATAQVQNNAVLLTNGTGLTKNRDFLISTQTYAASHTTVSKYLVSYLSADMTWAQNHKSALVTMLSKTLGLSTTIVEKTVNRRTFSMQALTNTSSIVQEQQAIADLLYTEGVIKTKVTVKSAFLT